MKAMLSDYRANPAGALLELATQAAEAGNERMRRVWLANYLRVSDVRRSR